MNTTTQSNNETAQSASPQVTVVTPQGTVLTREDANLIDMMRCLPQVDCLRTELRSWFLAYIANTELNKASLTCDYYEMLDSFLGVVISKGIEQLAQKGGEANV
ncbi:hypothetical protein [Spirosoma oryzicola]|uniref:hypothetical protein n=1 Tax=Spirosoma oryzicola TaxID=2898794 RepID=UPI001E4D4A4D|nr:hypothetical protein [Spirosoma oryzicola]UHG93244.1 hypothetical protein LQ777_10165 [Spirosoma oryzicola]